MAQYYQQYYYQQQQQMAYYSTAQPASYAQTPHTAYAYPTYAQPVAAAVPAHVATPTAPAVSYAQAVTSAAYSIPKKPNAARFAAPAVAATASATVAPSVAKPASANDATSWPPSLKAYVVRSFNTCQTDEDRSYMQDFLKKMMNKIASEGRLSIHKWDLEPTPELPRLQREAAAGCNMIQYHTRLPYRPHLYSIHHAHDVH